MTNFKTFPLILNNIAQSLFDKKGYNILALDVKDICTIADYIIIAEGTSERHVQALANHLIKCLEPLCGAPVRIAGERFADWIIIDYGETLVHLFIPELREYYALERLWQKGKIIDVAINISNLLGE